MSEEDGWGGVGKGITSKRTSVCKGTPFEISWHGTGNISDTQQHSRAVTRDLNQVLMA